MSPENDQKPQSSVTESAMTGPTGDNGDFRATRRQRRRGCRSPSTRNHRDHGTCLPSTVTQEASATTATLADLPIIAEIGQIEPTPKSENGTAERDRLKLPNPLRRWISCSTNFPRRNL